jgi:hypothetical protein
MRRLLQSIAVLLLVSPGSAAAPRQVNDAVTQLLAGVQAAIVAHSVPDFRLLTTGTLDEGDRLAFELTLFDPATTNAAVRERDRELLDNGVRVLVEILVDRGGSGEIATWQITLAGATPPRISALKQISSLAGLRRLELDTSTAFNITNFSFTATDFRLSMSSGTAFVVRAEEGVTAIVLRGKGRVEFSPSDPIERHQIFRFAKKESFDDNVGAAYIRLNPFEYQTRIAEGSLTPIEAKPDEIKNARALFNQWAHRSYSIALGDLSAERWSLLPAPGDALADFNTARRGWLSYARSGGQQEDVSLFNRAQRKNISVYASPAKLATRGRFYSEDTDRVYDVEHYDISTQFTDLERHLLSGTATMRLKLLKHDVGTLTIKLADSLAVSSVTSAEFGRLLQLRVVGQDSVLISLPDLKPAGSVITLTISYSGRLAPQSLTRESAAVNGVPSDSSAEASAKAEALAEEGQQQQDNRIPPEPNYAYTVNSFWYPQSLVTDYATARLVVTVPESYQAFATGQFMGETVTDTDRRSTFLADVPARYLSAVISKMTSLPRSSATMPDGTTVVIDGRSSPRQTGNVRELMPRAAEMLKFYASIAGGVPYPSFALLGLEADLPGGHSPAYFAALNQPTPTTIFSWRNDPIAFDDQFPDFFMAHEIAHQWWGHAVGAKNYHEQWLSEGLAQYFAYLYAGKDRGANIQKSIFERMRQSVRKFDDSGPISLGYRLGHVVGDGSNYRAIVYNKSVVVLDMLRQLIGDDAFSAGLRRFYRENRNHKAGTDDLRLAFEAEAKEPLTRFFDRWVLDSGTPELKLTSVVETGGQAVQIRIEQTGPIFDVPVTLVIAYEDRASEQVTIKVRGALTEERIPLHGRPRKDGIKILPII